MSTYTKEKNIITITLDGSNGSYRFDINTGIFYGIKGLPVKICPRKREIYSLFCPRNRSGSNLAYIVSRVFDNGGNTSAYPNYVSAMQGADKIDALGFPLLSLYYEHYAYLNNNIKSLSAWLKDHDKSEFVYHNFSRWCEFDKAKKSLGAAADLLTPDMYYAITQSRLNLTTEEIGVCAYYLGRGKYWEYHNGNVSSLVNYIDYCRALKKEPQKVNNFMREYCETKEYYNLRKTEFDNKRIADNYAKQQKAWEFEHGNFKILIPTCGQDLVTEGQLMHHCVGGYVNEIIENNCYICFVRKKETPEVPYITCQVYRDGRIGQYYLAYDRYINSNEDCEFKVAFQNHLNEVWNK